MGKRSAIREQLESYERSLGPRSGRLAATMQVTRTKLGCSARLFKFINMGLAIFLALSGVAILAAGAHMGKNEQIFEVVGSGFTNAVIAIGVFLLVTGALGMAGSMNESKILLLIYSGTLTCLILALIIMGSFAVSKNDRDVVGRAWQYLTNDERVHVQYYYACCGFNYCEDYPKKCQIPGNPCPAVWNSPCGPILETEYKKVAIGFGATAIVLGIIAILGVISACCINSGIDAANEQETQERRNAAGSGGGKKNHVVNNDNNNNNNSDDNDNNNSNNG